MRGFGLHIRGPDPQVRFVLARNLQITLVDAGHYSTEMPGL